MNASRRPKNAKYTAGKRRQRGSGGPVYSGRFVLRLSPELHHRLTDMASAKGASLNQICLELLRASVKDGPTVTRGWVPVLETTLKKNGIPLFGIVLFGSAARSEMNAESDIDLLLVCQPDVTLSRSLYSTWESTIDSIRSFHPEYSELLTRFTPQFVHFPEDVAGAGSLWLECALEGIVILELDLNISRFLRKIRLEILDGKLTREVTHGHPYWIRHAK